LKTIAIVWGRNFETTFYWKLLIRNSGRTEERAELAFQLTLKKSLGDKKEQESASLAFCEAS